MALSDGAIRVELSASKDTELRRAFLDGMSRLAAAVTVVTTDGPAGRFGQTVTATVSVTADPPALLVCLFRGTAVADAVGANQCFAVNVLGTSDRRAAADFAGQSDHTSRYKFDDGWYALQTGSPVRRDAPAAFDCHAEQFVSIGTHLVAIGRVVAVRHSDTPCLTYRARAYGHHAPLPDGDR